jgi:mono/diheme cytochrome c family protein
MNSRLRLNSIPVAALSTAILLLIPLTSLRAGVDLATHEIPTENLWSNVYFIILLLVVAVLFICIVTLSVVIKNIAGALRPEPFKDAKAISILIAFAFFISNESTAQSSVLAVTLNTYGGLSAQVFYSMLAFIVFLGVVLTVQFAVIRRLLGQEQTKPRHKKQIPSLSLRVFRYGMGILLLFLFVGYCYHDRAQMREQTEENYQAQLKEAEGASYGMKNAITELTVKYLNDTASLGEGRNLFLANCASCHMPDGGGLVGPNLTDNYWLHGSSIGDIFSTITHGYPAKGMKSWKDDFTAKQIAMLASFIKSLQGTTPVIAKDPEGVIEKASKL